MKKRAEGFLNFAQGRVELVVTVALYGDYAGPKLTAIVLSELN
jgi:hypothetical protein